MKTVDSSFVNHLPCANCNSSDANALYTDGHQYCFACGTHQHGEAESNIPTNNHNLLDGEVRELPKRRLTEQTCKLWGYRVGNMNGRIAHIANYCNDQRQVVAQKIRFENKEFSILGNAKEMGLFGAHLWGHGGKMIVVTEGELDAMTMSQLQNHRWPVVSVPNGANAAKKAFQENLDFLERFDKVVIMFDNDEQGIKAAKECAQVLSIGKAFIATLPLKDPSDMLVNNRGAEAIKAMWDAKAFRPDGIVSGAELWTEVSKQETFHAYNYPWDSWNRMTRGIRLGEIVTLTAGSSIGKSLFCREICYDLLMNQAATIGIVALEESVRRTALGIMGMHTNLPLHLNPAVLSPDSYRKAFDETLGTGRIHLYDHFGSMESENLMSRIRYMVGGLGCKIIVLDHVSIVVSGMGEGDERRLIDNLMTNLRSLVEELRFALILVSHLKRPEGKGHEEGAVTSLNQLRGSAGIGQLSDIVMGFERDMQDENTKHITTIRVLKNRWTGETGVTGRMSYSGETGRLRELAIEAPEAMVARTTGFTNPIL